MCTYGDVVFTPIPSTVSESGFKRHVRMLPVECREFDGSLVRHGKYIFLDVVWLTRILKPLLNHKDVEIFGLVHIGDIGDIRITLRDPLNIDFVGPAQERGHS